MIAMAKRRPKRKGPRPNRRKKKEKTNSLIYAEFEITDEPIYDVHFERLPESIKERVDYLYDAVFNEPEEVIDELIEITEKYPKVTTFHNYLTNAYALTDQPAKAREKIMYMYETFPNYLFAKVQYAHQLYQDTGTYNDVPEIFNNKLDLSLLYPRRKRFHISEVMNFYSLMGLYRHSIGDTEMAENYLDILFELDPTHRQTVRLFRALDKSIFNYIGKRFLGK